MEKDILDACYGSRMFWYNKDNPNVVFMDNHVSSFFFHYRNNVVY